jgi:carboxylesterase
VSLHQYGRVVTRLLGRVRAPLLILHSRNDRVIKPISSDLIYERSGSLDKRRLWFDRCNHDILRDCEADAVVAAAEDMLRRTRDRLIAARQSAAAR